MSLYPLILKPIYIEKIWGSRKLAETCGRQLPSDSTGESWEVSEHKKADTRVETGPLAGMSLSWLRKKFGKKLLGRASPSQSGRFPLIFKLLTPGDKLSVQVHPGPETAAKIPQAEAKFEMWYVLQARPEAEIIYGLKDRRLKSSEVTAAAAEGGLEDILYHKPIEAGQVIFLRPGMIHSIKEGAVIAEIQQNSDTTYRLYDWERTREGEKRPLHLEKARQALKPDLNPEAEYHHPLWEERGGPRRLLAVCPHFTALRLSPTGEDNLYRLSPARQESFQILFAEKEQLVIRWRQKKYRLPAGRTCLLPACLEEITVEPGGGGALLFQRGLSGRELSDFAVTRGLTAEDLLAVPGTDSYSSIMV